MVTVKLLQFFQRLDFSRNIKSSPKCMECTPKWSGMLYFINVVYTLYILVLPKSYGPCQQNKSVYCTFLTIQQLLLPITYKYNHLKVSYYVRVHIFHTLLICMNTKTQINTKIYINHSFIIIVCRQQTIMQIQEYYFNLRNAY